MNYKKCIIILLIILLIILMLSNIYLFTKDLNNFENIDTDIGNVLSDYFSGLTLSILKKEDFNSKKYFFDDNNLYCNYFFFKSLPTFIKYEHDDIYNNLTSKDITYDKSYINHLSYIMNDENDNIINGNNYKKYYCWIYMKPLIHKILDDTFKQCGLVKNVDNPIIHFRCADTPFAMGDGYNFQYYSFFKDSLEEINNKLNKNYKTIDIMYSNTHKSSDKQQKSCDIYINSLQIYLKNIGYETNIINNSNIDDFATLFYAPAVISTCSSFSFMSGAFSDGIFISPYFYEDKYKNEPFNKLSYILAHNLVNDYTDTDNVINLLKQK